MGSSKNWFTIVKSSETKPKQEGESAVITHITAIEPDELWRSVAADFTEKELLEVPLKLCDVYVCE